MAEAIANHLFGDLLKACSAGSKPKAVPNPLAIETLKRHNIPTADLRSKSWDHILGQQLDLVVTLCDSAARETCPTFPGAGMTHWSFPDPPVADGSSSARLWLAAKLACQRDRPVARYHLRPTIRNINHPWPARFLNQRPPSKKPIVSAIWIIGRACC